MSMFTYDQLHSKVNGQRVGRSLFLEFGNKNSDTGYDRVLMCLSKEDKEHEGMPIPSLYKLYVKYCSVDPTEFTLATSVFGSWGFWEWLVEQKDIAPYVEEWRRENIVRQKSKALRNIISESLDEEGKNRYQASKFLYEQGFNIDKPKAKDKPSKQEKGKIVSLVNEDWERLRNG